MAIVYHSPIQLLGNVWYNPSAQTFIINVNEENKAGQTFRVVRWNIFWQISEGCIDAGILAAFSDLCRWL